MPRLSLKVTFNGLPALAGRVRADAGALVQATALGIETDAKARAPVDTGTLRRSIHTAMVTDVSAAVGTDLEYAPFVEYGTARGGPAQPYLTPAAEAARPKFVAGMKKLLA